MATGRIWLALVLLAGCGTKLEDRVCSSDADCSEEYFCDIGQQRCLRLVCDSDDDCAQGYACALDLSRCLPLSRDGGVDGATFCDRDDDGAKGAQCDGDDCDDDDRTRYPGNEEVCNGQDDDCDDDTPEGTDGDDDDFCLEGGPLPCCAEGEVDCCDTDADAKPGQVAFFIEENACGDFDYDCSEADEEQLTGFGGCNCNNPNCELTPGWLGAGPACGASGEWVSGCTGTPCTVTCTPVTEQTTQGCH